MNPAVVTELGYIGIGAQDLPAWRLLTSDIFGMEWVEDAGLVKLRIDSWHNRIIMHPGQDDDLLYAGFRVAGPEEFRGLQEHLTNANIPFEIASPSSADERSVLELLRLKDPSGLPLEIFHGPRVDRHKPPRPGRGMHGHFSTGVGGLGHVILRGAGEGGQDSYRFYRDVLGMRGSIEAKIPIAEHNVTTTFMHCNERQHTVAFSPLPMAKNIHHLLIEVDNIDDVGHAYDLVQKHDLPILITLGRHSNDNSFSFYVQTPSGWYIEYGAISSPANEQSEYNVAELWGHKFLGSSW